MTNQSHEYSFRVYYEDTDAQGIVYHANYLKFTERARTEMMRDAGFNHSQIAMDKGTMFVMRYAEIDFSAPARLDDLVTIHTTVAKIGGASVTLQQNCYKGDSLLVATTVTLVYIDQQSKPIRIPDNARDIMTSYMTSPDNT